MVRCAFTSPVRTECDMFVILPFFIFVSDKEEKYKDVPETFACMAKTLCVG